MLPPNTAYSTLLLIAGVISLFVAVLIIQTRLRAMGARALIFLLFALAWWDITYGLFWAGAPGPTKHFWLDITYFGAVAAPAALFIFSLQITNKQGWIKRPLVSLIYLEPILVLLCLFTDPYHGLFFAGRREENSALILSGGPIFWFNVAYSYALILLATVFIVRGYLRSLGVYRKQLGITLVGILFTWLSNVISITSNPLPGADNTPFSFTITAIAFAFALVKYQLLNLIPVARGNLVEKMEDGVLVIDVHGRIVDMNPSAQSLLNINTNMFGRFVEEAVESWSRYEKITSNFKQTQIEIGLGENSTKQVDMRVTSIRDDKGRDSGRLITLHDITSRKQAEEKLRQQNEYLSTLHQITVELLDRPNPELLLSMITERAAALVNAQHGFIFLPKDDFLVLSAATNGFAHNIGLSEPLPGTGVLGQVWQSGEIFFVENYTAWEFHDSDYDSEKLAAVAGAPIKVGEKMAGVLEVANTDHMRPFSEEEIEILKQFALLASLVIDNTQLFSDLQIELAERKQAEERLLEANALLETQMKQIQGLQMILREQAIRDPLTGLYNRRYLSETQERELARAAREEYSISFVMIDIDHFKGVNDTFGHDVGDHVLRKLAFLIQEHTRAGDIICRYGGEEILAILPNVTLETAFQITDRWRVAAMDMTLPPEMEYVKITISSGISIYPEHGNIAHQLIKLADKAMYRAKALGRNRVEIWNPANETEEGNAQRSD